MKFYRDVLLEKQFEKSKHGEQLVNYHFFRKVFRGHILNMNEHKDFEKIKNNGRKTDTVSLKNHCLTSHSTSKRIIKEINAGSCLEGNYYVSLFTQHCLTKILIPQSTADWQNQITQMKILHGNRYLQNLLTSSQQLRAL